MDPVSVGTGAYSALRLFNTCARGAQDGTKAVGFARRKFRLLGTFDVAWLSEDFRASTGDQGFSANQLVDIGHFLGSAPVRPVLGLLAIANLAIDSEDSSLTPEVRKAFINEVRRWNSGNAESWAEHADAVFDRLIELHQQAMPKSADVADWAEDIEYYEEFINTPLQRSGGPGNYRARFVSELVRLATDIPRLQESLTISHETADLIAATGLDPIITHTDIGSGRQATFEALYIERSFVDAAEEATYDSSSLTSSETPFRIVVTGAPGAGKSTYIQHFRNQMCRVQRRPVFVVRCREYAATNWDRVNLVDFMLDRHNAEFSAELQHSIIRDMFVVGKAVVVLDGLDEVTDPLRRVELVKRINALAAYYPLASILITSREIGYDRAPVDAVNFIRLRLKEFTVEQAGVYVDKWFAHVGRLDLIDRFMHDSDSIPDLRLNPLMLSLLCLLYRESGAIPSRRLDIYAECARLLFHRWDTHRQIKIDGAIPDFSELLMQEIARWFFTSPTAQAGLDETVIKGMLKRLLIDQAGFPESKADTTSADFLEFCAGRAWLLGSIGSNYRGERLFSFTHKTFYEYFAAESFARNATSVADICQRIIDVFKNDSSSVLPELLIQSYGKHSAQGAVRVIKELRSTASPLLLLRLMEGATLPAHSRGLVFDTVAREWNQGQAEASELAALLQLNPLARDQFVDQHLGANADLRRQFLSGWAGTVLSGNGDRYIAAWGPIVDRLTLASSVEVLVEADDAIWNWLALSRETVASPNRVFSLLVCDCAFGKVPGAAWFAVERKLRLGGNFPNEAAANNNVDAIIGFIEGGGRIPERLLESFAKALSFGSRDVGWTVQSAQSRDTDRFFRLYVYMALALFEGRYSNRAQIATLWAGVLRDVVEVRRLYLVGNEPDEQTLDRANRVVGTLPPRIVRWMIGRASLVEY